MSTATEEEQLLEIEFLLAQDPPCEDDHIWDDAETGQRAITTVPPCGRTATYRLIESCALPAELICEPLAVWLMGGVETNSETVCSLHGLVGHVRIEKL